MKMVALEEICDLQIGKTPSRSVPEYWSGDLPWVTISDFAAGRTVTETKEGITRLGADKSGSKLIPKGTLLLSFKLSLGKRAFAGRDLFTNEAIAALQIRNGNADPNYLYWALGSIDYDRIVDRAAKGKTLNKAKLRKLEIPLPPLAEQKRIAAILDAADALRAKRREALAQLDTLLQATFLDLFGDNDPVVSIGDMLDRGILLLHKDGNHGSLYPRADEFGETGIPFLSAKCISETGDLLREEVQYLREDKARKLKLGWIESGDVLLAHNASVGKSFGYSGEFDEALIGTSLTAFRANPKVLDPAYLLGALRSQNFQQQLFFNMGQTTRNQVPITAQRRLSIRLPALDRQVRFASVVRSIEEQRKSQGRHLAELDTLFASLQSRAFRGEL